jgi:hypothetical protein
MIWQISKPKVMIVKKLFVIFGLLASSFVAMAGPREEVLAALETAKSNANGREQIQSISETVVRGYVATTNGLNTVPAATQLIGFLASRVQVQSAVAPLGYTLFATQRKLEIYKETQPTAATGTVLLVFYDANDLASEVYIFGDVL